MTTALPHVPSGTTLRHIEQLIAGLTSGVILMDPAGALLWANEAALVMHGVRAVADLGATAEDYGERFCLRYRNGHRLQRREYPLMRMLAAESFPDLVVEIGPRGSDEPRWVHHVRDVVMSDADGEPDCLALVIQDVSDRYEAEERFETMFQANPAPALIVRLSDQRYARVNRGFLEMTGHARGALVGRSLFDLDILSGAERAELARERLAEGRTIPQMEAELPLPGGHTKLVILAGQPIEVADEKCMLFTFADLEPRRKAEHALRASEKHFATVFRMAPVAMALTTCDDSRLIEANDAFQRLTGLGAEGSIGLGHDALGLWADPAQRDSVAHEVASRGGIRNADVRVLHADGKPIDCLLSAERIALRGEPCVLWLYQDITARRSNELELVTAIEAVMKDANWFSRSIMDKLATLRNPRVDSAAPPAADLTQREHEVLGLICEGLDDRAIAARLDLSANTVRNHVARIYAKIGVNRRSGAMVWARQRGLDVAG